MIIDPQTRVYEGMIVGQHTRENDLVVNASRARSSPTCAPPARTRT